MGKRSKESFQKRAREKARQEKQAEKRARRQSNADSDENLSRAHEDSLMQEFARLSERHEAGRISFDEFEEERHRIFVELGLEQE